jgi:hypothetical protein
MNKKIIYAMIASLILATYASAQFPIRIPKIKIPKIEQPKKQEPTNDEPDQPTATKKINSPSNESPKANSSVPASKRQMVMDDGYTFFTAKPVKVRNSKNNGDVDVGWHLVPKLRLMGTFPDNSGFRLKIKQKGKELSNFFCGAMVYRSKDDRQINPKFRANAVHDDFMYDFSKCSNTKKGIKEIGWMDVEIYYVDGDTDGETLVRKHKIDVHKAENIKGYRPDTYPGVSEYFIQRYAENAVGIIFRDDIYYQSTTPFKRPGFSSTRKSQGVFMSYLRDKKTIFQTYLRCSVNGQRIAIEKDRSWLEDQGGSEFDSTALMQRNDPGYSERITFSTLRAGIPTELSAGKWECSFMENGVTYRTFRFEVGSDNEIIPHPEQQNGNINLYHNSFLVEVEIPEEVTEMDSRSLPMPDAGLFYGIPWTTPEGKAAAAKIPKRGKPYPVLPK